MKNLQIVLNYLIESEKNHFEEEPSAQHIYISALKAQEELKTVLNYADHFAERLQDALSDGRHPFGSGNSMSSVLNEYSNWKKENGDEQEAIANKNGKEAILAILQAEYDEAEKTEEDNPDGFDYNNGFKEGIGHVMRMIRENKI